MTFQLHCFVKLYQSRTIVIRKYYKQLFFNPRIMPKDNKYYLIQLQKQRKKLKVLATKYAPSQIYLQVLGNGNRAEHRSLLLTTDHTNYLFNCGEGTQRLATEYHSKLSKIEHIFVTKPRWNNIGGIPGVALSIQETGVPKITLHGPEGTSDIIEAIRNFVLLTDLSVLPADTSKIFADQAMTVNYVLIENPKKTEDSEASEIFVDVINYYEYQVNPNGKRSHSPNNLEKKFSRSKSTVKKSRINSMMIYICKINQRAGALDFQKCVDAGIKPGPNLGKLKAGEDITLPDGRIVRSQDVVSDAEEGPLFIVMECPNEDWIDAIIQNSAFEKYQNEKTAGEANVVNYIIHFTPENVLQNSKYRNWMQRFGTETQHLIINEENKGYTSEAMHKMQHQLHLVHPTIFPFLGITKCFQAEPSITNDKIKDMLNVFAQNTESNESIKSEEKINDELNLPKTADNKLLIHRCQTMHGVYLRPSQGLNIKNAVQIQPKEYVEDMFKIDGFLDALADLQTSINAQSRLLENTDEYPRLLMLGTGSSVPNKIRNTSSMLLQLDEKRSILLDCGEATINQIVKFFGETKANEVLKTVKAVYISHLHADHHMGLIGLLKRREEVTEKPLYLLAPQQISSYLNYYHCRFEPITKLFRLISNRELLLKPTLLEARLLNELNEALNITSIRTIPVTHCPYAYGVAITLRDGRKISYSGDLVPCENFQMLAENSFLMIHEATMEDELEEEAKIKRHSTISQAINVGLKAKVDFTLLTHFSQRYSKIPRLPNKEDIDFQKVGIAFDFMMISLSQLQLLPLFYPILAIMFNEFQEQLYLRALKREKRKENLLRAIND